MSRKQRKKRRSVNLAAVIPAVLIIVFSFISSSLYKKAVITGSEAMKLSYQEQKLKKSAEYYDRFYQSAVMQYSPKYTLSTDIASVNGGSVMNILEINDTAFIKQETGSEPLPAPAEEKAETPEETEEAETETTVQNSEATLELPFRGTFTLNLNMCEIITDEYNNSVKVRIPHPELTEFAIDFENARLTGPSGILVSNSEKTSSETAREQFTENDPAIREYIISAPVFSDLADRAAMEKIRLALLALNPHNDITIETEFAE